MMIAYITLGSLYIIFLLVLILNWRSIKNKSSLEWNDDLPTVCIVVVARNEEENIGILLASLFNQNYPPEKLEIFIFDDQSEDATAKIIEQSIPQSPFKIQLLKLEKQGMAYKKSAISQAVRLTNSELILSTDADCQMGKNWVLSMASSLVNNQWNLSSGPVTFKNNTSFFECWQNIEFASLVGTGAATMQAKWPTMCNGANLIYRKSAFEQVNGYNGVADLASGDDEFLMHKIATLAASKVGFVKDQNAIVSTQSQPNFTSFWHQRRRWSGKWKHYQVSYMSWMAIFIFLYHLSILLGLGSLVFSPSLWPIVLGMMGLKMLFEWIFLKDVLKFLSKKLSVADFVFSALFYSFYAVIFGIAANFGTYSWKGRKINNGKYE